MLYIFKTKRFINNPNSPYQFMKPRIVEAGEYVLNKRFRKVNLIKSDESSGNLVFRVDDNYIKLNIPDWETKTDLELRRQQNMFINEKKASKYAGAVIPFVPEVLKSGIMHIKDQKAMNSILGHNLEQIDYILFRKIEGDQLNTLPVDIMPFEKKLNLIYDILRANTALNNEGIVHNDAVEDNILFNGHNAYLLDFGFSGNDKLSGFFSCTPELAAPEQARALKNNEQTVIHDQRTDVYLIGELAYRLLTHENPYDTGQNSIEQRAEGKSIFYTTGNKSIDKVISKATHPDITKRYSTTKEFLEDFKTIARKYCA